MWWIDQIQKKLDDVAGLAQDIKEEWQDADGDEGVEGFEDGAFTEGETDLQADVLELRGMNDETPDKVPQLPSSISLGVSASPPIFTKGKSKITHEDDPASPITATFTETDRTDANLTVADRDVLSDQLPSHEVVLLTNGHVSPLTGECSELSVEPSSEKAPTLPHASCKDEGGDPLESATSAPTAVVTTTSSSSASLTSSAMPPAAATVAAAVTSIAAAASGSNSSAMVPPSGEEHLLRFQRQLAEEMEAAQVLREENQRLRHHTLSLEREVTTLRQFKRTAADPQRVAALEREGAELSTQLGRERERCRGLQDERAQLTARVATLTAQLAEHAAALDAQSDLPALLETATARVTALEAEWLLEQQQHAATRAAKEEALAQQRAELHVHRESASGVLDTLRRERAEALELLQRSQCDYERRLQQLERALQQSNRRADAAEARVTLEERTAAVPLREMRAALEDVEHQRRQLQTSLAQCTLACDTLRAERAAEAEGIASQLALAQHEATLAQHERVAAERERHAMASKLALAQQEAERESARAAALEAVNEQLTTALEEARRQVRETARHARATPESTAMEAKAAAMSPPNAHATGRVGSVSHGGVGLGPLVWFQSEMGDTAGDGGRRRVRMERELVRQALEIERLRRVEATAAEAERKLAELAAQHDMLLQMYGQLQEDLQQPQQDGGQDKEGMEKS